MFEKIIIETYHGDELGPQHFTDQKARRFPGAYDDHPTSFL